MSMKRSTSILIVFAVILACILNAAAETGNGPFGTSEGCFDLSLTNLGYQSPASAGSECTITFMVTNNGDRPSDPTTFTIQLPGGYIVDGEVIDNAIPSLQPGQSTQITVTFTIPADMDGLGVILISLASDLYNDCIPTNNQIVRFFRILPEGVTFEQFWAQTVGPGPWYKISVPYIPPSQGSTPK